MNNTFRFAVLGLLATASPSFAAPASEPFQKPTSLLALAGYAPLSGEGVTITLSDRPLLPSKNPANALPGLVHDFDVLTVVNSLRFAGAQGITVGGVRLTNQSSILCIGPVIFVDKTPVPIPLRIEAIGNSALLKARLEVKGGTLDAFKSAGPRAKLQISRKIRLAAAPLPPHLKSASSSN